MPKVALHTLGCKVNQYETQRIADDFVLRGFEVVDFSERADVYVINSCTVTLTADSKSRQAARAAANRNPHAKVVLTGCYAETSADAASQVEGVSLVIGNQDKSRLVEQVSSLLPDLPPANPVDHVQIPATGSLGRTRALLKVQDGCDQFCAYCAVPMARPVMWSKPLQAVIAEGEKLARNGYKEIVLTGIRVGRYDDNGLDLVDVMAGLAAVEGIARIRLSSIELTDIPGGLLPLMAENEKICRHLHLPLQSGDDEVLRRMNRPYTSAQFEEFAEKARIAAPGIGITTDIIVGFPGETEAQFENTVKLAERIEFSRAHVFRYSPRPGTASADLVDDVPPAEKEHRSAVLIERTSASAARFAESLVGITVSVLAEGKAARTNLRSGLTDNYVRVFFEAGPELAGQIVRVHVESAEKGTARGRIREMQDGK